MVDQQQAETKNPTSQKKVLVVWSTVVLKKSFLLTQVL